MHYSGAMTPSEKGSRLADMLSATKFDDEEGTGTLNTGE